MATSERIVICPGSYDPVTNGHLDIIGRAVARVRPGDRRASSASGVRKSKTMFTAEERRDFLVDATSELANVEIEIFTNLLVEFARERGARAILKGLRAISDFEYELEMNQLNRKLSPEIEPCTCSRRRTTASSPRPGSRRWRRSGATSATSCPRPCPRRSPSARSALADDPCGQELARGCRNPSSAALIAPPRKLHDLLWTSWSS